MVLMAQPYVDAYETIEKSENSITLMMTPQGEVFDDKMSNKFAKYDQIILICGHYEGFDERIFHWVDAKVSIGDYVLTGGELPALVIMDAVARFIPGVLGKFASAVEDSFSSGLLEYPQYTRPDVFEGLEVPEVLRNGNHALINRWRRKQALKATWLHRPELLGKLVPADAKLLAEVKAEAQSSPEMEIVNDKNVKKK